MNRGEHLIMRFFASLVLENLGKSLKTFIQNCTGEENTRASGYHCSNTLALRVKETIVSAERGARATWSSPISLLALFVFSPPTTPTELAKSSHTRRLATLQATAKLSLTRIAIGYPRQHVVTLTQHRVTDSTHHPTVY